MTLFPAAGLALVLGLSPLAAIAQQVSAEQQPARLTVTGEGRATAAPDMATISLGVMAADVEAALAVREMSDRMAAVLNRLTEAGIEPRDVQTSGLSVTPRWQDQPRNGGKQPVIEAFVASTQVTVRVRDLDSLGGLLDAVVQDGANTFRGLTFGLQEPQPKQDEARQAAVKEAARKAALYAEAAGVALGPILSIDENGGGQPRMMRAEMASFAADDGMPVAAGEVGLSASVTITYSLQTGG